MTSASEWNAIAEACEVAEGPSREIDTRIACQILAENGLPAAVNENVWIATALTRSLDVIAKVINGRRVATVYKTACFSEMVARRVWQPFPRWNSRSFYSAEH